MIHGIEGTPWGWEPIPKAVFEAVLDHLQDPQIWVAPFGSVCAYWQAEKILEQSKPAFGPTGTVYKWRVPAHFPRGVRLKVKLDYVIGKVVLSQSGRWLASTPEGV